MSYCKIAQTTPVTKTRYNLGTKTAQTTPARGNLTTTQTTPARGNLTTTKTRYNLGSEEVKV